MGVVNDVISENPERGLALSYAPADKRAALVTLFALDDRLRRITRAARDPMIGLMRLTWWREALERLDIAPPPAEPLLQAIASAVLPLGMSGDDMAALIEGWERLLEPAPIMMTLAEETGGRLFTFAAQLLGGGSPQVADAGTGWALVGLSRTWPDFFGEGAAELAPPRFAAAFSLVWPRPLRPLGALALLARADLDAKSRPGSPVRVARLLAHRLTGR
ncbi:squalene/phytoene synthase family protein [Sphingomonas sp.]|uniref:squalene/phytoene synthase family protein n=1 Tax=Sphingomonas sp. TaxID=28214 RepID=UPI003CC60832